MHAAVKILLGFVFIAVGLGFFVDSIYPIVGTAAWIPGDWLTNFVVMLTGVIPAFLIVLGLFIVWLEIDEIKAEKELRAEEEKEKKSMSEQVSKPQISSAKKPAAKKKK